MIILMPIGVVGKAHLESLRQSLPEIFGQNVRISKSIELPKRSWNQHRGQHLASMLLAELPSPPSLNDRVLGVVDADIFAPGLNFIFGEADIAGRRALISLQRSKKRWYPDSCMSQQVQ